MRLVEFDKHLIDLYLNNFYLHNCNVSAINIFFDNPIVKLLNLKYL